MLQAIRMKDADALVRASVLGAALIPEAIGVISTH